MKHLQFLHFLKKAGIVAIASISIMSVTVHKASALTDDAELKATITESSADNAEGENVTVTDTE